MSNRTLIPVYLNQRFVFDLLAMLQGGISTVTSISRSTEAERSSSGQIRASFGLSDVVASLLKVDLSSQAERRNQAKDVENTKEERIYTPASLFYQLRGLLEERDELQPIKGDTLPKPGDLVEFKASLTRNPVVQAFDSVSSMLEIVEEIEKIPTPGTPIAKLKKPQTVSQSLVVRQQVTALLRHLRAGDTIDLSAAGLPNGLEAVLTLEVPYLSDPTLSDLVDGHFVVLGKVIRSVNNANESINFLRKTPLAALPESVLTPLKGAFDSLAALHNIKLPAIRWEVPGPAIHVLPVAIYA
jgi:hypothetical protein